MHSDVVLKVNLFRVSFGLVVTSDEERKMNIRGVSRDHTLLVEYMMTPCSTELSSNS